MKYPRIKIIWTESMKMPIEINVKKLTNGFLVGNTFVATEERLADELVIYFKDPHAKLNPPQYND